MARFVFFVFLFAASTCVTPVVGQETAEMTRELANLERLQTQFATENERARTIIARQIDQLIAKLKMSTTISDAEKRSRIEKWEEEKRAFMANGELPLEADLVEVGFMYAQRLVDAQTPVVRRYNELMKSAIAKKQDTWLQTLRDHKTQFENSHLPGRAKFSKESIWNGSIYDSNGRAWGYRIHVTDRTSDAFNGLAAFNTSTPGHAIYAISGSVEGIHLQGRYNEAVRGQTIETSIEGVILGETLILRAVTPKKQKNEIFTSVMRRN